MASDVVAEVGGEVIGVEVDVLAARPSLMPWLICSHTMKRTEFHNNTDY